MPNLEQQWADIPHIPLKDSAVDECLNERLADENPRLYRQVVAKRALLAAFENADEDPEAAITDLLSDLRHLCDALGLDFHTLDSSGHNHYCHELAEFRSEKQPA